jgi:NADH-quinone oxidoreductase subunit H
MMIATLFFGGWDIPFTNRDLSGGGFWVLLSFLKFFALVLFWVFFSMWIRWTLPRFRYDQLMALGWKVLMPLALAYIMIVCLTEYVLQHVLGVASPVLRAWGLTAVSVVLAFVVFRLLDRGLIVSGSVARRERVRRELAELRAQPSYMATGGTGGAAVNG